MTHRSLVMCLYRNKLKIARYFGYIPGKWNKKHVLYENAELSNSKIKKLGKAKNLGNIIGNTVRFHYKIGLNVVDEHMLNDCINVAFFKLKKLNRMHYDYVISRRKQLPSK